MPPHRRLPLLIHRMRRRLLGGSIFAALVSVLLQGLHPAFAPILLVTQSGGLLPQTQEDSHGGALSQSEIDAAFERAWKLRLEGAYEEAAAAYRAAAHGSRRGAALLRSAEALLAGDYHAEALDLATLALHENPALTDAYALRAAALEELGEYHAALEALAAYSAADPVGGYGAFDAAEIYALLGDTAGARESYRQAMTLGLNKLWEVAATRRLGESYLAAGEAQLGADWLERAAALAAENEARASPVWFDGQLVQRGSEARRAAILLRLGTAQRRAGAAGAAAATYGDLVVSYPATAEARDALSALAELGASSRVDAFDRGLVLFHAGRYREAIAAFSAYLATGPAPSDAAVAQYFAARAQAEAGDRLGAASQLVAAALDYPTGRYAPDALLRAARLRESAGRVAEATATYLAVADTYPTSDQAAQALHRAAWAQLRGGNAPGARESWRRLGEHHDPGARAQGLFWLGRGMLGLGDAAAGRALLEQAAETAPWTYEGLRAQDLADHGLGAEPYVRRWTGQLAVAPPGDREACTTWINTWSSDAQSPERRDGDALPRPAEQLARLDRLLLVGMPGPALSEALDGIAAAARRSHELHDLARGLTDRGLYPVAMHAARQLAVASPAGTIDAAPHCLQRLAHPLAFADLVQREAQVHGLDPYLVLGLLRQESWFSVGALSSADARGLGQVIPSTGREIARALGRRTFSEEDLYRPQESVAFCAWYLAQQYADLQRRPLLALAAYNAGAGNARRWSAGNLRIDPDDYVEAIDFTETRGYVRSIYQNYARYRDLYG